MRAYEWIERLKIAKGWESDYRVAKELGLTRGAVSRYRNYDCGLDESVSLKIAELLDLRPAEVLIDQMRERTKSDAARDALTDVLKKIGGTAASILLAAGLVSAPTQSRADPGSKTATTHGQETAGIYIVLDTLQATRDAAFTMRLHASSQGHTNGFGNRY